MQTVSLRYMFLLIKYYHHYSLWCVGLEMSKFEFQLKTFGIPMFIEPPFTVQACQGSQIDHGVTVEEKKKSRTETDGFASYRTPLHSDFMIAHSTVAGYYSWRNTVQGSWFIQVHFLIFLFFQSFTLPQSYFCKYKKTKKIIFASFGLFKKAN